MWTSRPSGPDCHIRPGGSGRKSGTGVSPDGPLPPTPEGSLRRYPVMGGIDDYGWLWDDVIHWTTCVFVTFFAHVSGDLSPPFVRSLCVSS